MTKLPTSDDFEVSQIRIRLVDPMGRPISNLKLQVKQGARAVAQGSTDEQGRLSQFSSRIGAPLSVHVEHFLTKDMKCIREMTPWTEVFSVILVSAKIKEKATLAPDKGEPGNYRRKTYLVKAGDTLGAIARKYGCTARDLARLNDMDLEAIIYPGQLLKLPSLSGTAAGGTSTVEPPKSQRLSQPASAITAMPETPAGSMPKNDPANTKASEHPNGLSTLPDTKTSQDRGENGTPKPTPHLSCPGACIKLGDKGPLIEEINIRLTGFGGTISAPTLLDEFTKRTESAVKQFQRDYMGTAETGKVCGSVLAALDEFRAKYPIDFEPMKCNCGCCNGFGNGLTDSTKAGMFKGKEKQNPFPGIEYPGIHRSLFWALRAALFYTHTCDKNMAYSFMRVSSGYRCWHSNAGYRNGKIKEKTTTTFNHMGNAFDLQFRKGESEFRCQDAVLEALRSKVFMERLGAQMNWKEKNKLSLEPSQFSNGDKGATSWIHVDVRQYEPLYLTDRHYATSQTSADGLPLARMALQENHLPLLACGGLNPDMLICNTNDDKRLDVASLSISEKGIEFIKGWEKCKLQPYDDSRKFCTIGWGHFIAAKSCDLSKQDEAFKAFANGISQAEADQLLMNDIRIHEKIVKDYVQVPMLQQEYDALVSLIFNTGSFRKCPKLLSKLNTKDYSGCRNEFSDITNNNDKGLIKRRNAEIKIFHHNVYDHSH